MRRTWYMVFARHAIHNMPRPAHFAITTPSNTVHGTLYTTGSLSSPLLSSPSLLLSSPLLRYLVGGLEPLLAHLGVERREAALGHDPERARGDVLDVDVLHLRVHAEGEVARKRPRGGRPREERGALGEALGRCVLAGETDDDGRVADVLVVLPRLEVADRRVARRGVRHDLETTVHEVLLVDRLEHPPHALHVPRLHRLVVVLEVDPAPHAPDRLLPLLAVPRHDAPALRVVRRDPHLHHVVLPRDPQLLVDLVLHRETVAVPPEAPLHVVARLVRVPRHHVLNRPRQDVTVVRRPRGEGRPVVEVVLRLTLRQLQRRLERVDLLPVRHHLLLLGGERDSVRDLVHARHGGRCAESSVHKLAAVL